ncbi:MAG: hypothetical protein LBT82_01925 [Oscillospiraceae bacterium]|jgi:hypothetical protein|nr:hypothetical protein [Oscillospiraceae bacterium]
MLIKKNIKKAVSFFIGLSLLSTNYLNPLNSKVSALSSSEKGRIQQRVDFLKRYKKFLKKIEQEVEQEEEEALQLNRPFTEEQEAKQKKINCRRLLIEEEYKDLKKAKEKLESVPEQRVTQTIVRVECSIGRFELLKKIMTKAREKEIAVTREEILDYYELLKERDSFLEEIFD